MPKPIGSSIRANANSGLVWGPHKAVVQKPRLRPNLPSADMQLCHSGVTSPTDFFSGFQKFCFSLWRQQINKCGSLQRAQFGETFAVCLLVTSPGTCFLLLGLRDWFGDDGLGSGG